MSLEDMRQKYMNLLNEQSDQNESDSEQWEIAYKKMKKNRSKIIQSQSIFEKMPEKQNKYSEGQKLIKIKQKLGQCIENINLKEVQIQELNKKYNLCSLELVKAKNQIFQLKIKNQQLQKKLEQINLEFEIEFECLERQYKRQKIDAQLKTEQIVFYQKDIQKLNLNIFKKEQQICHILKEQTKNKKYKKENQRLRVDVQRLFKIINKFQRQKKYEQINCYTNKKQQQLQFSVDRKIMKSFSISNPNRQKSLNKILKGKHYIGKPLKNEKQFKKWCPQILISEVQYFLKSQHIGYNNKVFVQNLVKFIEQYTKKQNEKFVEKLDKKYRLLKSEQARKYNHSLSIRQIRQSTLKMLNLTDVDLLKQSNIFNSKTSKSNTVKQNFSNLQKKSGLNTQKTQNDYFYSNRMNKQNLRKYKTQLASKKVTQNALSSINYKANNQKTEVQTQDLCKNLQNSLKMNNIVKKVY